MGLISYLVYQLFNLITLVMLISVLLSWIPNLNRLNPVVRSINQFAEFFFAPFRRIIPPIGMIDISPIFAFLAIYIVENIILRILAILGL